MTVKQFAVKEFYNALDMYRKAVLNFKKKQTDETRCDFMTASLRIHGALNGITTGKQHPRWAKRMVNQAFRGN